MKNVEKTASSSSLKLKTMTYISIGKHLSEETACYMKTDTFKYFTPSLNYSAID